MAASRPVPGPVTALASDPVPASALLPGAAAHPLAEPAQPGAVVDRPPPTRLCGPDWTDDCER